MGQYLFGNKHVWLILALVHYGDYPYPVFTPLGLPLATECPLAPLRSLSEWSCVSCVSI